MRPILFAAALLRNLSVLALHGINVQLEEAEALYELISSSSCSLMILQLQRNALCDRGLLAITRGLASSNITTVQIMKNKICATRIGTLCTPVSKLQSPIILDTPLSLGITELMGNNKVRNLQLDCNPIGADGAVKLARALNSKTTLWCCLSSLRLGYAQLAASGCNPIVSVCPFVL